MRTSQSVDGGGGPPGTTERPVSALNCPDLQKDPCLMYRLSLMRIEQEKAMERMSNGGGSGESGRQKSDTPARADETTAEQFGISRDTMQKEMTIVENHV